MQKIDPHTWCFLSGRICALENNLLRRDFFENLLPLEKPEAILSCLKDSPLRGDFLTPEDVVNFEEILERRLFRLLQEAKDLSPTLDVWELLQTLYDLINLKNFLKEKLLSLKRPTPFPGPYSDETWESLWQGTMLMPASILENAGRTQLSQVSLEFYQMAINDLKRHLGEILNNPGLLDLILDGTYIWSLPELAKRTNSAFILNYYLEYQKLVGILFLWRVSKNLSALGITGMQDLQRYISSPLFTPPITFPVKGDEIARDFEKVLEETLPERIVGAIHELPPHRYEKAVEDTLMEILKDAKYFAFGPERVFGYLKALEIEVLNLRLAIGGRLNGIPSEQINRRLRKVYV
ncbi:MAG TPA: V-type ATPase subunit, partial [Candidatus Hypogeohydataceae bacterium YC40]